MPRVPKLQFVGGRELETRRVHLFIVKPVPVKKEDIDDAPDYTPHVIVLEFKAATHAAAADAPELELSESVEQCKSLLF